MPHTIFITGANRGLGLEFVRQYAAEGERIYAACRHPESADDLKSLQKQYPQIQIIKLDVESFEDIHQLKNQIKEPIDILINNAGILETDPALGEISIDHLIHTFTVNAIAPLKMVEALREAVSRSEKKLIVSITSSMGSISDNTSGGYYSYRAAKAALNMLMKSVGHDLAPQGIKVLLLHPGWVKTRMGGEGAMIDAATSISGMKQVIANYHPKPSEVGFYSYAGKLLEW